MYSSVARGPAKLFTSISITGDWSSTGTFVLLRRMQDSVYKAWIVHLKSSILFLVRSRIQLEINLAP